MSFVVRLVSSSKGQGNARDTEYGTKAEALGAIEKLGKLSSLRRTRSPGTTIYIVTPKGK